LATTLLFFMCNDSRTANAECRERVAIIASDIEAPAIDRVLDAFGYQGELEGRTPRAARTILFYRNKVVNSFKGIGKGWTPYVNSRRMDRIGD
jgi:hypothetical protein